MADSDKTQKVRKNYRREFKQKVIKWFYDNERNVARTASQFEIDRKVVRRWVDDEVKIKGKIKKKSRVEELLLTLMPNEHFLPNFQSCEVKDGQRNVVGLTTELVNLLMNITRRRRILSIRIIGSLVFVDDIG